MGSNSTAKQNTRRHTVNIRLAATSALTVFMLLILSIGSIAVKAQSVSNPSSSNKTWGNCYNNDPHLIASIIGGTALYWTTIEPKYDGNYNMWDFGNKNLVALKAPSGSIGTLLSAYYNPYLGSDPLLYSQVKPGATIWTHRALFVCAHKSSSSPTFCPSRTNMNQVSSLIGGKASSWMWVDTPDTIGSHWQFMAKNKKKWTLTAPKKGSLYDIKSTDTNVMWITPKHKTKTSWDLYYCPAWSPPS
jgi:hypothetical protein